MVRRITKRELCEKVRDMPRDVRHDYQGRAYALAGFILREMLGVPFGLKYLHPDGRKGGNYLRLPPMGTTTRATRASHTVLDLAEILFNLQRVPGFYVPLGELSEAPDQTKVESTFAELEVGRLLFIHRHRLTFRYRRPRGKTQDDYDFDITLRDGTPICADAKCKLEGTAVRIGSIENTLNKEYQKLPRDKPGIMFVKVPQHWLDSPEIQRELLPTARRFLRNVTRLVSLVYFVPTLSLDRGVEQILRYLEISNPRNRFDGSRNWELFEDRPPPEGAHGWPRWYTPLIGFPDGLPQMVARRNEGGPEMSEAEIAERLERALRKSLTMPHQPRKPPRAPKGKTRAASKGRVHKAKSRA
jgi:hypothetical protein